MPFKSLGLSEPLLKTIAEQNYTQPYPIQQEAIPAILKGNDILGIAKTGSGKTASFVLPILEWFQDKGAPKNRSIRVLVLVPTRELAVQIEKELWQKKETRQSGLLYGLFLEDSEQEKEFILLL